MQAEIIASIILGFWMGAPVGWFLKSAFTWRREARRLANPEPMPLPPSAPPIDSRLEKLVERFSQRLETLEDRLEFTERLLESRTHTPAGESRGRRIAAESRETGPPTGPVR